MENENISNNIPNERELKQVLQNAKEFKLWRGSINERKEKISFIHAQLKKIYNTNTILNFGYMDEKTEKLQGISGYSLFLPLPYDTILLTGKISVITYLTLYLRSIGIDPRNAQTNAKRIFSEIFPVSAKKLIDVNGLLVKADDIPQNANDPNNDPVTDGV